MCRRAVQTCVCVGVHIVDRQVNCSFSFADLELQRLVGWSSKMFPIRVKMIDGEREEDDAVGWDHCVRRTDGRVTPLPQMYALLRYVSSNCCSALLRCRFALDEILYFLFDLHTVGVCVVEAWINPQQTRPWAALQNQTWARACGLSARRAQQLYFIVPARSLGQSKLFNDVAAASLFPPPSQVSAFVSRSQM